MVGNAGAFAKESLTVVQALALKISPIVEMTDLVAILNGCEKSLVFVHEPLQKISPLGRNDSISFQWKNTQTGQLKCL